MGLGGPEARAGAEGVHAARAADRPAARPGRTAAAVRASAAGEWPGLPSSALAARPQLRQTHRPLDGPLPPSACPGGGGSPNATARDLLWQQLMPELFIEEGCAPRDWMAVEMLAQPMPSPANGGKAASGSADELMGPSGQGRGQHA